MEGKNIAREENKGKKEKDVKENRVSVKKEEK